MFTRSNGQNAKSNTANPAAEAPKPATQSAPAQPIGAQTQKEDKRVSIISNDLTIMGQDLKIISKSAVQVDGEIQGEIRGIDVTVGPQGKVTGTIAAQTITIDGQVMGTMKAQKVQLRKSASVEGDIHHQSLVVEEGAVFDGRSKRHEDGTDLHPQLNAGSIPAPDNTATSFAAPEAQPAAASQTPPPLHN